MKAEDIKIAEKIIDKHAEFTDHYADQEYTKEGILKMMEEYALYTEPVSEREIEVIDILTRLVNLKAHKDRYGKDETYTKEQPILWDKAKAILTTLNNGLLTN
ncbi:MAG TPA: hypothetical protein ENH82_08930 [bacterium]|nr:hypothetical protein [bacterium]